MSMTLSVVMIASMGMHHMGKKEGDPMESPMGPMAMLAGGEGTCPDPMPIFLAIFGVTCDEPNCLENAPICLNAIMPPGDMCEYMKTCRPKMMGAGNPKDGDEEGFLEKMGKVAKCICQEILKFMDLEYVPGDKTGNMLKILEVTISSNPNISEVTKNEVMSAVHDEICVLPVNTWDVIERVRFDACVMKICVKSMAAQ